MEDLSKLFIRFFLFFLICLPCIALAEQPLFNQTFYVLGNAGLFTGTFNTKNVDLVDVIPQSISETLQQKGYTAGLGLGYSKVFCERYLLGAEISGGWMTHTATFQSGAATSAFTDKFAIENYLDLVFVPGIFLTPTIASYLKAGVTRAEVSNSITTPTGFDPIYVHTNKSKTQLGFTFSLGVKKWLSPCFGLYAEYNYKDLGTVNFAAFENFTTTYSHSAHVYGQGLLLGAVYQWI